MRPWSFLLLLLPARSLAQTGIITGSVTAGLTNKPIAGATVAIQSCTRGTTTDSLGHYSIGDLPPGLYQLKFTAIGYREKDIFDIQVGAAVPSETDVSLEEAASDLKEVTVSSPRFSKTTESPVSLRSIGATEIDRNPGGNRDISKVLQSLPGVGVSTTFRNDIIIRGGSPTENKFYIDGIEIPNINHFSTQGASGGPVGLINVDLIRSVDFYSGAFPADKGNALSSIIEFHLKNGAPDKDHYKITLGSSDLGTMLEGPLSRKTTCLASYRYSYLQDLFKWLDIPFLPSYQDFQFKIKTAFDSRNELTFLGLGAIDRFRINTDVPHTEINDFTLANIPYNAQNNYTVGATYKHFGSKGYTLLVLSRDYLDNIANKFAGNDRDSTETLNYSSTETETKFRIEKVTTFHYYRLATEAGIESDTYSTRTFDLLPNGNDNYSTRIDFLRYGASVQLSRSFFDDRLALSAGTRVDGADLSHTLSRIGKTLSPRLSASYNISSKLSLNCNAGVYYELPSYTFLGFKDSTGRLSNTNTGFISNRHLVFGVEFNTLRNSRFTLEGFYKQYPNYPLVRVLGDTVPLADLGNTYIVTGNYQVAGQNPGSSFGVEFLAQQRLSHGFYGILALTVFKSEFEDKNGYYRPSAWDSRYILTMTGGKILPKNWQLGAKLRVTGGSPFTPYNVSASSLKSNYAIYPGGIPDYRQLNSLRLRGFYQADIRIDKKYLLRKFDLRFYVDIQDVTGFRYDMPPVLVPELNAAGNIQDLPGDPSRIKMKLIGNPGGNITPTIGIIFER